MKQLPVLLAVALNPSTKKPFKQFPIGEDVIYGFKQGKKITPLTMEPQRFFKVDLQNLQKIVNKNDLAIPKSFIAYQKKTSQNEFYKKRTPVKIRVLNQQTGRYKVKTIYKEKGDPKYIYKNYKPVERAKKLKISFKPSKKYRLVKFIVEKKKIKLSISDYRLQERNKREQRHDQILSDYIPLTREEKQGAEGYKTEMKQCSGATLDHTIIGLLPSDDYTSLKKQGYQMIGMSVTVVIDGEPTVLDLQPIPITEFSDIKNYISKNVRNEILSKGKTYTKLIDYAKIKNDIFKDKTQSKKELQKKWKAVNTYRVGTVYRDMQTAINQKLRGETPEIRETKSVKLSVTYRYYKGMQ